MSRLRSSSHAGQVQRPRLSNREIALLLYIVHRAGLCGRMTLAPARRAHVVGLWRRYLIEVWFRCAPGEGCCHGPYFNLTADGYRLADSLLAAREERKQKSRHSSPRIAA